VGKGASPGRNEHSLLRKASQERDQPWFTPGAVSKLEQREEPGPKGVSDPREMNVVYLDSKIHIRHAQRAPRARFGPKTRNTRAMWEGTREAPGARVLGACCPRTAGRPETGPPRGAPPGSNPRRNKSGRGEHRAPKHSFPRLVNRVHHVAIHAEVPEPIRCTVQRNLARARCSECVNTLALVLLHFVPSHEIYAEPLPCHGDSDSDVAASVARGFPWLGDRA
jgi:hypothetical protein